MPMQILRCMMLLKISEGKSNRANQTSRKGKADKYFSQQFICSFIPKIYSFYYCSSVGSKNLPGLRNEDCNLEGGNPI